MELNNILQDVKDGKTDLENAEEQIRSMGYVPVSDIAKLDTYRKCRTGIMEAILAEGKDAPDIVEIAKAQVDATGRALITRLNKQQADVITEKFDADKIDWDLHSRTAVIHNGTPAPRTGGVVAIISAGTADIDVAEEARLSAYEMGCETIKIYDVGVAGLHRLIAEIKTLEDNRPDAIVVAAGREGTLPTIVSGLVDVPVIGLPVSTGYGAGAKGEAALLSMLQSCSIISVVNIDAGFVAGTFAARIANTIACSRRS